MTTANVDCDALELQTHEEKSTEKLKRAIVELEERCVDLDRTLLADFARLSALEEQYRSLKQSRSNDEGENHSLRPSSLDMLSLPLPAHEEASFADGETQSVEALRHRVQTLKAHSKVLAARADSFERRRVRLADAVEEEKRKTDLALVSTSP
jgi:hypothetical protein